MPVLRQRHTRDYTVLPNALLQDQQLSFRDIGLLAWMLSKPQDWKFTYEGMLTERTTDGKSALQKSVKSLQSAGYLRIEKKRYKGKLAESIWYVYDSPHMENQYMVNSAQQQNAVSRPPHTDSPYMVNQSQQNKDKTKGMTRKNAVSALEGGTQLPAGYYIDPVSGEWRRRENA